MRVGNFKLTLVSIELRKLRVRNCRDLFIESRRVVVIINFLFFTLRIVYR